MMYFYFSFLFVLYFLGMIVIGFVVNSVIEYLKEKKKWEL